MKRVSTRSRAVIIGGTVAAAAGLGLVASAPAENAERGLTAPAKIKMVVNDQGPSFVGDPTVAPGQNLKVVNRTNPKNIGPHFFTIADANDIPDTKPENKACNKLQDICGQLAKAHKIEFGQRFKVNRKLVKKGLDGWDKEFTDTSKGDSWYTQRKGASKTQVVSAPDGTTLSFFCVIHRGMQGEISVQEVMRP